MDLRDATDYRTLFELNPLPMWVFDAQTLRFLAVNEAAVRGYGFSREELLEMTLRDIRPPEEVPALMASVKRAPEFDFHGPFRHRRKDGSLLWVEISGQVVEFAGREARLAVCQDVTARVESQEAARALEQQLRASQRVETVGRIAAGLAHDFNNLLTVIQCFSNGLAEEFPQEDPRRDDALEIRKASERGAGLIKQLLSFGRRQLLKPETVNPNEVVRATGTLLRGVLGESIRLKVSLGDGVPCLKADPVQLEHVLLNLAFNARDAMPSGGALTVETAAVPAAGPDGARRPGHKGYVRLSVKDTGHGMAPETKARIFEPFFTTKEPGKGTGLGLASIHGFVNQSGGTISVDTAPGAGTTFHLLFPAVDEVPQAPAPQPVPVAAEGGHTVLVVEDDEAVRTLVSRILRKAGHTVLEASHPGDALMVAEVHAKEIDAFLIDVVLPWLSGPKLAERLSRLCPAARVLYISGNADPLVTGDKAPPGMGALLEKPFAPEALVDAVGRTLAAPAAGTLPLPFA